MTADRWSTRRLFPLYGVCLDVRCKLSTTGLVGRVVSLADFVVHNLADSNPSKVNHNLNRGAAGGATTLVRTDEKEAETQSYGQIIEFQDSSVCPAVCSDIREWLLVLQYGKQSA